MGGHAPWVRRGIRREEGILWGMPGESRGTLRAAPCACVELISSPLPFSSALRCRPLPLSRSRVLAAPEESTKSLGTWPRCLFAPTYPPLLIAASLFLRLSLSLSSSLSRPLASPPSPPPLYLPVSPLFVVPPPFHVVASYIPDTGTH